MVTANVAFGIGKRREWWLNGRLMTGHAWLLFGIPMRPAKLQPLAGTDLSNCGTEIYIYILFLFEKPDREKL
jgi:hypothetical protein